MRLRSRSVSLQDEYLELLKQDVIGAAQRLLGATLIYGDLRAEIVETEAYRAADAVSYTHLDVYKRQSVNRRRSL